MTIARKVLKRTKSLENQVADVLSSVYRRINVTKLVALLNAGLPRLGVRFSQRRVKGLGTHVVLTGYCEYDSSKRSSQIVIQVCYDDPLISIDICNPNLGVDLVSVLIHELTHREQKKLFKSPSPGHIPYKFYHLAAENSYLTDHLEIEAFANDFAYQMYARGLPLTTDEIPMLTEYRDELKGSKELKRLLKKIYRNLEYLPK